MEVKCLSKSPVTYTCNHQLGVTIKVTILQNFFLACTPNGAVMYISLLYVGSISDVQLTRERGFLDALCHQIILNMSVMADRGFTIKTQIEEIGAKLNIPPFLDGCQRMSPDDVKTGRRIASLRIHVGRVIGRVKNYSILKGVLPLSMSRIANSDCVCVCFLSKLSTYSDLHAYRPG